MNIYEDLRPLQGRLRWWTRLVLIAFVGICAKFWQIQIVRFPVYDELALANHVREIPESAPRGLILSRRGKILVENRPSFNITMERDHWDEKVLARLVDLLEISPEELEELARRRRSATARSTVLIKEDITLREVALIEARQLELPGVMIQFVPRRFYPSGSLAAHALGYVGRITEEQEEESRFDGAGPDDYVGQNGVELVYNRKLMGENGAQVVVVNSHGRLQRTMEERPPRWGNSVQLSLDENVQHATEKAFGENAGGAVALDPRTGEVLALASFPPFDPNIFSGRFDAEGWRTLVHDEKHPLQNRAIQGRYPPGSVFKLVIAAAALEEGVISPSKRLYCGGAVRLYGARFPCHKASGHGFVDLNDALVQSCNSYFYQVGVELEIETIARYAALLGLGSATGIDLPYEVSGLVPDPEWKRRVKKEPWYAGETVSISVGQGSLLVTVLQLAELAAIVSTGGEMYKPHLFLRPLPAGAVSAGPPSAIQSEPARRVELRETTWQVLRRAMSGVVNQGGTGWRARIPEVEVAGKTGTAQVASMSNLAETEDEDRPERLRNHAWFVGFAPAAEPEIALAVLVEHGGAGGRAAAPIAREIFKAYFEGPKGPEREDGNVGPTIVAGN